MNDNDLIKTTEALVKECLDGFDSGHDWWHIHRVRNLALYISKLEGECNSLVVELGALLHDIDDKKFRKENGRRAEFIIRDHLRRFGIDEKIIEEVISINRHISFSSDSSSAQMSIEFCIVQDADRLDAIGAIGVARAFNYGGFRNNAIYIPGTPGSADSSTTIGHFYDKLLKLKGLMNTSAGRKLAEKRHLYLEEFLEAFYNEWETGS
jgi:uncharacterized protein